MSKKKKNKGYKYFNASKDNKKKSKKKDKGPKLKVIHPTVDRKDAKKARKIITAPVEIPKEFTKIREKCNHADKLITPAEFREMTPAYSAYTPVLDMACELYGEDHVHVCKSCYDVIVDPGLISVDDVDKAILTLYLASNKAVSLRRLKDDEVKAYNKLKAALGEWNDVAEELEKIDENENVTATGYTNGLPSSGIDLNSVQPTIL